MFVADGRGVPSRGDGKTVCSLKKILQLFFFLKEAPFVLVFNFRV